MPEPDATTLLPNPPATVNRQSLGPKVLLRLLAVFLLSVFLAQLLNYSAKTVKNRQSPAGFTHGMLHGAMMPCTMPAHLIGQEVEIYAQFNDGHPYKLGYTLGVNLCGAMFFGLLYRRLHRWRLKRAANVKN